MRKQLENKVEDLEFEDKSIKNLKIITYQPLPNQNHIKFLNQMIELYSKHGRLFLSICSFHYGVIEGKRKERQRKKRRESH